MSQRALPPAAIITVMIVINYAHPVTQLQLEQIEELTGERAERVIDVPVQFDDMQPFEGKAAGLVNAAGLSAIQWQSLPLIINLPSLSTIAALLLAELHGRMGFFPAVMRLRRFPRCHAAALRGGRGHRSAEAAR